MVRTVNRSLPGVVLDPMMGEVSQPDIPNDIVKVSWEHLAVSPVRRSFNSHLLPPFAHIQGEAGDNESQRTMFCTSIIKAADQSCGLKVVGAYHGGNLRTFWWRPVVTNSIKTRVLLGLFSTVGLWRQLMGTGWPSSFCGR